MIVSLVKLEPDMIPSFSTNTITIDDATEMCKEQASLETFRNFLLKYSLLLSLTLGKG